jgi:hypothetical protein
MKRTSTSEFIQKSEKIHQGRYDYSLVVYIKNNQKVKIICPSHGIFEQTPVNHLSGGGCVVCWNQKRKNDSNCRSSREAFIEKASVIHHAVYDYSLVEYTNVHTNVKIICKIHGIFEQTPGNHLSRKTKCPQCSLNNMTLTVEQQENARMKFIQKANNVHQRRYDYSLVKYISCSKKVKIICPNHGTFEQTPDKHIYGKSPTGCPQCSPSVSRPEINWLNVLGITYRQHKMKLDNKTITVDGFDPSTNTVYEFLGDFWHGNPQKYKSDDINPKNHKTFGELYQATVNRNTLITSNGYRLVLMWESDWNMLPIK